MQVKLLFILLHKLIKNISKKFDITVIQKLILNYIN